MPRRKPKAAPQRAAAPTRAPAPGTALVERAPDAKGVVTVTAAGLALIESTAREGGSQALIAGRLGIALSTLKQVMSRCEDVRVAFERGKAEDEYVLTSALRASAAAGYAPAAMFLLKTQHGYREKDDAPTASANIQIVQLPAPMSVEQYAQSLAQRDAAAALPAPTHAQVIDVESTTITTEKTNG